MTGHAQNISDGYAKRDYIVQAYGVLPQMRVRNRDWGAFTLIELLVVIGIIAVLLGILLPALSKARESSRRLTCASQIRQVLVALRMYSNQNQEWLPPGNWGSANLIGAADTLGPILGGDTNALTIFTCPETPTGDVDIPHLLPLTQFGDGVYYYVTTYIYVGGRGMMPPTADWDGTDRYFGWPYPWWYPNNCLDPRGFGPVPRMNSRVRASEVALFTDRMWPKTLVAGGQTYTTDDGGIFQAYTGGSSVVHASHRKQNGETAGGNVGYMDGHVDWRDLPSSAAVNDPNAPDSTVKQRVITYYGPLVVY